MGGGGVVFWGQKIGFTKISLWSGLEIVEPAPAAVDVTRNGAVILKSVQYKTGFLFQIWFGGNTDRWLCTLNNASTVIVQKMKGWQLFLPT